VFASSIFLDFNLPNAATWFYFSLLLVAAIFFRFNRFWSLRNWDLCTLFLLVPGFLLLQQGHFWLNAAADQAAGSPDYAKLKTGGDDLVFWGYVWLIAGSGYYFARCLLDLALERRPTLTPNLNLSGLASLAVALFICLTTVAVVRTPDMPQQAQIGKGPLALTKSLDSTTTIVNYQAGQTDLDKADTRFWVERTVAMLMHLAVIAGLILIGKVHFGDVSAGMGAACLYLLLPYTAYNVSQVHHVWPAVFILWAIYTYRRPILTGLLLGIAAGTTFFPLLLFPLWCGFYRGRGTLRFTFGFVLATAASLAVTAIILLSNGEFSRSLSIALSLSDWQAWKEPVTESIWTGAHWAYRLPVFIGYMAFVVLTAFWPSPRNLGQVIAQTAAVVIGVQFWYADQGGVYVLWYLPFLLLMMFRPNLMDRRPPLIQPEADWLLHWATIVKRRVLGLFGLPQRSPLTIRS
jgi:hypothetical protein